MKSLLYFEDGDVVAESGDVKVYQFNNELFLEIGPGHTLWALESEVDDYINQLWDYPKGRCLEIGLGLGVASRCILTNPKVKNLTTVELRQDVINTHEMIKPILDDGSRHNKWLTYVPKKHRIVNCNGLDYLLQTERTYDFIFIDFYACIDEESLAEIYDMVQAAKRILNKDGSILCWLDKHTPKEFIEPFYSLFGEYLQERRYRDGTT